MVSAVIVAAGIGAVRSAPVDIPFQVTDHAILVHSTVNGKDVTCMFDTGFSGAYVLNDSVNVGTPTGAMTLQDFVGTMQAKTVNISKLQLGSVNIDPAGMMAVKMPNENYSVSYGTHCDGIMGLEVMKSFPFQINFEKSKFVILPSTYDISKEVGDNKSKYVMRMLPKGNNSIELTVRTKDDQKMYLALDTGNAFYATTHKDVLERLGLWKTGAQPKYTKQSWVATGAVDSWSIALKDLSIFGVPVETAVFDIIDLPSSSADHDGTVGFGFLKNFNITVDMKKRMVVLEHFSGRVSDEELGTVGLGAVYNPRVERMWIYNVMPGSPADKAGIKRGDHLIGINGELVNWLTPQRVEDLLEGEPGSEVNLSTSRNGNLERHVLKRELMVNVPNQ